MNPMNYSISEAAKKFDLETHTLRYYEKEGIISPHKTERGIRYFTDSDLEELGMVCCLRSTGMPIKDIKKYFDLCSKGDTTLENRMKIFTSHREHILQEIEELQKHLLKIEEKIKWYSGYIKCKESK